MDLLHLRDVVELQGSSDADSMISVPQPSTRSTIVWRNCTLLIRLIGMSMPWRTRIPSRTRTRRLVSTKCVVRQRSSGPIVSQAMSNPPMTPSAIQPQTCQSCSRMRAATKKAAPTVIRKASTGTISIFQCGCSCSTTVSSGVSSSSGKATQERYCVDQ